MFDKFNDECGVFGIFGTSDAAAHTALGLHALQHRGQEAAGIVACDGDQFSSHRALGHVGDNFNSVAVIRGLPGDRAIGHNRYATTGGTLLRNVQPFYADLSVGGFALAHNGNLTNAMTLRQDLIHRGSLFASTSDTEVIVHLVALSRAPTVEDRLIDALKQVEGAYSLVILCPQSLIGVRDPHGVRPLVLGKLGDAHIIASETCALDIIGASYVRDIAPGEIRGRIGYRRHLSVEYVVAQLLCAADFRRRAGEPHLKRTEPPKRLGVLAVQRGGAKSTIRLECRQQPAGKAKRRRERTERLAGRLGSG